jgi:beta-lactam-binding protein with PASTA domain
VGADLVSAMTVLRDNQMNYVIVEYANRTTPKGLVISQSPGAGSKAGPDSAVTLYVSAGVPR